MRTCIRILFGFTIVLLGSHQTHAQVTVSLQALPEIEEFANNVGFDLDGLEAELAQQLEEVFHVVEPVEYLRALADAQAFSSKGLGVDYATNPTVLSVGVTGNATVAFGDKGFDEPSSDQPVVGLAANISIMAGVNFSKWAPKPFGDLTIYGNFFTRDASIEEMKASMTNWGVHAQYKFFRPKNVSTAELALQWGGLDITTGIEFSRLKLSLEEPLTTVLPVGEGSTATNITMTSTGRFDFRSSAYSVPIEISTNVRMLYVLTLFGGMGFDFQLGSNNIHVQLDGDLVGKDPTTNQDVALGTGVITVQESANPRPGKLRFFAGVQLNLWRVRAFVQGNLSPDRAAGVTLGTRLAW